MTGFRRKRSARNSALVRINQGAGSTHLLHLAALANGRIGGLGHVSAFAESTGERPLRVDSGGTMAVPGRSGIGASLPFPLASAEVGYLSGHRPFSLGGGNGSKCPQTGHPARRVERAENRF
jgi:hypothetical protein